MIATIFKSNRIAFASLLCLSLVAASAARAAAQATRAPAQTPSAAPASAQAMSVLTIKITGVRNAKGKIRVHLFRDGKGFPMEVESAAASQIIDIDPKTMTATAVFKDLPQGNYAASVMHDENLSGKMDFDAQGIPQEGYGISNNPDTTQGPPSPDDAKFVVSQPESAIEIKMFYWQ